MPPASHFFTTHNARHYTAFAHFHFSLIYTTESFIFRGKEKQAEREQRDEWQ